jgi:hypothetical protein
MAPEMGCRVPDLPKALPNTTRKSMRCEGERPEEEEEARRPARFGDSFFQISPRREKVISVSMWWHFSQASPWVDTKWPMTYGPF